MGLKNDSPSSKLPHNPPLSNNQPSPSHSKHEIEEIFSEAIKKKSAQRILTSPANADTRSGRKRQSDEGPKRVTAEGKKKKKKKEKSTVPKSRRKTEDGLTIYREDELGWNRKDAGGTPLCPFDCDCCF